MRTFLYPFLFTERGMNNKKRLCRSRAVEMHTEKISAWRTGVHRWQGCALHAMLEQRLISASGSPLAGQPPEMRSRAPQFSGKAGSKKKRLCRSRAVEVHTEKISAWRTGEHRWQGCALHAMLEQRSISASGSPLAGQPPEMRSRAPQFSGKAGSKKRLCRSRAVKLHTEI